MKCPRPFIDPDFAKIRCKKCAAGYLARRTKEVDLGVEGRRIDTVRSRIVRRATAEKLISLDGYYRFGRYLRHRHMPQPL
jgi:hypothetical protein